MSSDPRRSRAKTVRTNKVGSNEQIIRKLDVAFYTDGTAIIILDATLTRKVVADILGIINENLPERNKTPMEQQSNGPQEDTSISNRQTSGEPNTTGDD